MTAESTPATHRPRLGAIDAAIGVLVAMGLVVAPLVADPRLAATRSLYVFYRLKAMVVVGAAIAVGALLTRHRLRLPTGATARAAIVGATALASWSLVSGVVVDGPLVDGWEQATGVLLPLLFVLLLASGFDTSRPATLGIRGAALLLSLLVVLEVAGVRLPFAAEDRPAATLMHRNDVAFQLAAALPLVVAAVAGSAATPALLFELALDAAALAESRSRTGWIAAAVALVLWATLRRRRPKRDATSRRKLVIAVAGAATAVLLLAALAPNGLEPVPARLRRTLDVHDAAMQERYVIFADAARLVAARPIFGYGAGSFAFERLERYAALDGDALAVSLEDAWSSARDGWLVGAAAGQPGVRLIDSRGDVVPMRALPPLASHPQLAPRGHLAAFTEPTALGDTRAQRLRVVDVRDGRTRLSIDAGASDAIGELTFAPDGSRLVFTRRDAGTLSVVALGTSTERSLAAGAHARAPLFVDGTHVVFWDGPCLSRVATDGGMRQTLRCFGAAPSGAPALSPRGDFALTVGAGDDSRVEIIDRDGRPIVALPRRTREPVWRRDGGLVFVARTKGGDEVQRAGLRGPEPLPLRAPTIAHLAVDRDDVLVALVDGPGGQALERLAPGATASERVWQARPPRRWPWADHPHADLLAVAYEAGLPAALALALVLAAIAAATVGGDAASAPWCCVLAALMVLGTTNAPLALPSSAFVFWMAAAALWSPPLRRQGASACT